MARRKPISEVPAADTIGTQTLSVRLPSLEMRRALTEKCDADGVPVARFVADVVEAYLDGRLRIVEKVTPPKPSYLVSSDT